MVNICKEICKIYAKKNMLSLVHNSWIENLFLSSTFGRSCSLHSGSLLGFRSSFGSGNLLCSRLLGSRRLLSGWLLSGSLSLLGRSNLFLVGGSRLGLNKQKKKCVSSNVPRNVSQDRDHAFFALTCLGGLGYFGCLGGSRCRFLRSRGFLSSGCFLDRCGLLHSRFLGS
jgi:hypothetical protein